MTKVQAKEILWPTLGCCLLLAFISPPSALAAASEPIAKQGCPSLTTLQLPGIDWKVMSAEVVPAGPLGLGPRGAVDLPEHCKLQAEVDPRTGVGGRHYGIGFELRLPFEWNGKFFFQGGGGMDGLIRPAIGAMPNGESTAKVALARGYAVASTDAGHEGHDGSFGADQQARIDYYYRAIEVVARVSRQVLAIYYGAVPKRSYFLGCSNGGRQGLMAAQRFPLLFDGVVAGDPAFNLTRAGVAELWDDKSFLGIAPKNTEGQPILSRAYSDADLKLVSDSVMAHCDQLDGLKDGSIDNPQACHYDPAVLTCKGEKREDCLREDQVSALALAFGGPKTSAGKPIYSDWPYDAGVGTPGWRIWKLGTSGTAQSNALNMTLGLEATKSIHMDIYHSSLDPNHFDFDTAAEKSKNTSALEDAPYTAMTSFSGRGSKLILFTGMSDPIFSANDLIRYYRQLQADNGGDAATKDWARLYLIPGMTHCGGGPALDDFDPLSSLEAWVENGVAPEQITAQGKAFAGRTRAMCSYPSYPHYKGSGSIDDAASFECRPDAK
jgi:pimeloyl-ACP methyl ester carboxylesterase